MEKETLITEKELTPKEQAKKMLDEFYYLFLIGGNRLDTVALTDFTEAVVHQIRKENLKYNKLWHRREKYWLSVVEEIKKVYAEVAQ